MSSKIQIHQEFNLILIHLLLIRIQTIYIKKKNYIKKNGPNIAHTLNFDSNNNAKNIHDPANIKTTLSLILKLR